MFTLTCEQVFHVRISQSKRRTINFHSSENIVRAIDGHMVKHGLDWTSKTWTGPLVNHGLDSKAPD